ncbi:FkbM family methyltransferase [Zavarzinia aquatilis]|uniref:FkbM family methyltransferase n=1 Tax=Zavarzinia aquatilis TaxID=2211142 RepID=A0A317EJ88_9PROT|nr:FkbM family methyltransferase [Zavarzinia aquatilis]
MFWVCLRREPLFRIAPGAGLLKVPADFRYTSVSCYMMRDWAEIDLHFLDRLIGPGDVFIDVGANIGIYSLRAAPLVGPAGLVVAVEPGRLSADRLAANVALNPDFTQIRLVRKAVSDREGRATFFHVFVGDDPQTFSLLTDGSHHGTEEVEVTTLDRLMAELAPGRLDCLKIDVEGVEAQVISGAAETIARHRPIILFEVNADLQKHRGDDKSGAFRAIEAFGYDFFIRQADGRLLARESVPEGWGNLVAIHPEGRQPRA